MELITVSLALTFLMSIGLNIWAARQIGKLSKDVTDRDDLIEDLRSSLGGVEKRDDWRNAVL